MGCKIHSEMSLCTPDIEKKKRFMFVYVRCMHMCGGAHVQRPERAVGCPPVPLYHVPLT